jgi:hypothetical protein
MGPVEFALDHVVRQTTRFQNFTRPGLRLAEGSRKRGSLAGFAVVIRHGSSLHTQSNTRPNFERDMANEVPAMLTEPTEFNLWQRRTAAQTRVGR